MKRKSLILAAVAVSELGLCGRTQCETAKLVPINPMQGDEFGCAVAIEGECAIVGAYLDDDLASQAGAAFVFRKTNGVWTQTQQLLAGDGQWSDNFGMTVAMSGNLAVIGAPNAASTLGPFTRTGVAYVFEQVGGQWLQRAKLVASNPAQQDLFSSSVAISGQRIVIGAWAASPAGLHSGAAYVFEGSGTSWSQVAFLLPPEVGPADAFGSAVAIDGDRLLVGAHRYAVAGGTRPGGTFVFERDQQGSWVQQQLLLPSTSINQQFFGIGVAINADRALVGAAGHQLGGGESGAVYAYDWIGGTWVQTQFVPGTHGHAFGGRIALDGDLAIIGTGDDDHGSGAGASFAYGRIGTTWQRIAKMFANDAAPGNAFGQYLALSGTTVLLGSPTDDVACPTDILCNSGSAYAVELAPTAAQYGHCTAGGACVTNMDVHGGCGNATGQGAYLQACGSGSVVLDDLRFEARHLNPGTSALFFMGSTQINVLFGNGRRVVGGGATGIFRLGIQTADAFGVITRGPGLVAQSQGLAGAGHISAGQTWNLQYWYRDLAGPCMGGFNLTNGLQVTFVP
jgi:hypothetical protein